jgi:transcriptional regulator with XRE-family HTH domain
MGTKADIDIKVRRRIAAHLRRVREESRFPSDAAMAAEAGVSRSAMNRALKGERTVGLDFLLAVHANLGISIDLLVDDDPAPEWFVEQEPRAKKRRR